MSGDRRETLDAVQEAEARLHPPLEAALRRAVSTDVAVERELRAWSGGIGGDDREAVVRRAAEREANHLTNRVRFRVATGREPPERLRTTPVTPYRGLKLPGGAEAVLDDLNRALRAGGDVDADLIGARYETVLTDEERRARGQFYTPPSVADAVVRWALAGTDDRPRVLDPAAGTGTFPLAVHDVLRDREPEADVGDLHDRLVAVDVDAAALHLAALRLSARGGAADVDGFDRHVCSFFELDPTDDVGPVDVVVGNPPFVRAGDLSPDRGHFRDHLDAIGPPGETPYADGEHALSGRSDASVYFVTHASRFLRPGGRLGMVLPAKWLESRYGVAFRRFLADHYRVHAVVGFSARAFDALVDTVLLLAERRSASPGDFDRTDVEFVRLGGDVDVTTALAGIGDSRQTAGGGPDSRRPSRVVERSHATFAGARQCSPYLRAPEPFLPLLDHSAFVPLGELASVRRGVTTGANRFFLLDRDDLDRWGIEPAVLQPALRSIRSVSSRTIDPDAVERWILDVHDVVATRRVPEEEDPTTIAKAVLEDAGHGSVVAYVEHAEDEGWHEGRTCQARSVWFDLGRLPVPDAFVPKLLRERVFTVRNRAGAVPSNAIDCLAVRDGVDPAVLLGALDSSLVRGLMEIWGRDEAGMLQLMTDETRTLPVPDVRQFSETEAARVREAAGELDADGGNPEVQSSLDRAVLDPLDLGLDTERVRSLREGLLRQRVDGGARVEPPNP